MEIEKTQMYVLYVLKVMTLKCRLFHVAFVYGNAWIENAAIWGNIVEYVSDNLWWRVFCLLFLVRGRSTTTTECNDTVFWRPVVSIKYFR